MLISIAAGMASAVLRRPEHAEDAVFRVDGFAIYTIGQALAGLRARLHAKPPLDSKQFQENVLVAQGVGALLLLFPNELVVNPKGKAEASPVRLVALAEALTDLAKQLINAEAVTRKLRLAGGPDFLIAEIDEATRVLKSQLSLLPVFYVPKRLGYDTVTLLDKAGEIFGTLESDIMAIAGAEVREAGRCLAFELWTAFGFHLLRACELVIIDYCRAHGFKAERGSWNTYLKALGQKREVSRGMKRALDRLKKWDRDEVMHPARMLTEPEAESLLDDVRHAMREMVIEMKSRRDAAKT